jgi:hypothetical protein
MFPFTELLPDSLQPTQISAIRSWYWEIQFAYVSPDYTSGCACTHTHTPSILWACLTWHYDHNQHDNSLQTYYILSFTISPSMNWPNTHLIKLKKHNLLVSMFHKELWRYFANSFSTYKLAGVLVLESADIFLFTIMCRYPRGPPSVIYIYLVWGWPLIFI